jgi:hypothetical protein
MHLTMQIITEIRTVIIEDRFNNDPISSEIELDIQNKIRERNKKLEDPKLKKIFLDCRLELDFDGQYLWRSDPDRQFKDVYDLGEVNKLNKEWENEAVLRDIRNKKLIRTSTGNLVEWLDFEQKWTDKRL